MILSTRQTHYTISMAVTITRNKFLRAVFLEHVILIQPVKNIPAFTDTRTFITAS
jgi:hypothetical protein